MHRRLKPTSPDLIQAKTMERLRIELDKSDDFFPKKTYIRSITAYQIKNVEQLLNDRPVRKFKYKTPNQVLFEKIELIN